MNEKYDLIRKTLEKLDEFFVHGAYRYLDEALPELASEIENTEKRIHEIAHGDGTVNDLKVELRKYWYQHVELMKKFDGVSQ